MVLLMLAATIYGVVQMLVLRRTYSIDRAIGRADDRSR
jgi:hypothetical protein